MKYLYSVIVAILMIFSVSAQNKTQILDAITGDVIQTISPDSSVPSKVLSNFNNYINSEDTIDSVNGIKRLRLYPTSLFIGEQVVTANRFNENRKEIPRTITLINSSLIRRSGQQTTADLLQSTGEVFVQKSQGGGGSPVLRGLESNRILLVIDGVRMNNAIFRGGHLQNVLRTDQNMTEQVEVIFGPGTLIYGSDAMGGVIHLQTIKPKLSVSGKNEIGLTVQSTWNSANNYLNEHVHLTFAKGKWAEITGISLSQFGDLKQGSNRNSSIGNVGIRDSFQTRQNGKDVVLPNTNSAIQKNSGYSQIDFTQGFVFKQSNHIEHSLTFQYSKSSDVPRYDRLTEKITGGTYRYAEWYYGPELRMQTAYQMRITKSNRFSDEIHLSAAWQYTEESRHNRSFGKSTRTNRNEFVTGYVFNLDLKKEIGNKKFYYGAELITNDVISKADQINITTNTISPQSTRYPDGGSVMNMAGIYLNILTKINNQLSYTAGLRYNYVYLNSKFNDKTYFPFVPDQVTQKNQAVTAQTGVNYNTENGWMLSLSISSGFRAPNVDDMGKTFESAGGDKVILPNPLLSPEYIYNSEFNITKLVGKTLSTGFTFHYSILKNALVVKAKGTDSILFGGKNTQVTQMENAMEARIVGFQYFLSADLNKHWQFKHNMSYCRGWLTDDNSPMDHIPPFYGRTSFSYQRKNWRSELYGLYNGAKALNEYSNSGEDNLIYATPKGMPSWYTINISFHYSLPIKSSWLDLRAACENITDENYRTFASGISAPGRNFQLSVRYRL